MLRKLFALTEQGAKDLKKGIIASVFTSLSLMMPMGLLLMLVMQLLQPLLGMETATPSLGAYAGMCLVLLVIIFLTHYIQYRCTYIAAYAESAQRRIGLAEKLRTLPLSFFGKRDLSDLTTTMMSDCNDLERVFAYTIPQIFGTAISCVIVCLCLFFMDWRLALVTLLPICISLWMLSSCLRQPDKAALQAELHDAQERMQGTVVEYIHGMSVVKVFNRTLSAFRRYEGDLNHFTDVVERTARANARPMGAYYAFFGAQLLFLLPAALLLIPTADSYLDFLPVILLFFLVGGGLKEPLENMMQMVILSSRILEGVRRMDNILRQPEPDQEGTGNPTAFDVEFSNVEFAYTKGIPVVDHVSFRLPQGTVTGLVGPSGGGKSTLAQLLLRFYEPQAGSIRIGGVDIRDIPPDRLADLVAYVFQDSVLFTDTIENNIRMGNTAATMAEVEQAAKNAGIHEVIQALPKGYQTVV